MQTETEIDGVKIYRLTRFEDKRGWLMELHRSDWMGDDYLPVMSYLSLTYPGVSRGPHEHRKQTDYLCFPGISRFVLLLWDNRPDSSSYRRRIRIEIEEGHSIAVKVPPGVVHAYKNVGTVEGWIINAPDRLYGGENKSEAVDEIRYEDDPDSKFVPDF
jgi:dTDP-4-dehydrorhamnose 3,5-epimerase